jgi:hypothetical protein
LALPVTDKLMEKLFAPHKDGHFSVAGSDFRLFFRLPPASASTKTFIQD